MKLPNKFSIIFFSLGIILTTATQLRLETLPIGLGELILMVWAFYTFINISLFKEKRISSSITKNIFLFWIVSIVLLLAGSLVGSFQVVSDPEASVRDFIAYIFSALITILVSKENKFYEKADFYSSCIFLLSVFLIIGLFAASFVTRQLGPLELYYGEARFSGWAKNPNQLGLLLNFVPWIGLHLSNSYKEMKIWYLFLSFAIIGVGIYIGSDALNLAWIISGLLFYILCGYQLRKNKIAVFFIYFFLPTLFLVLFVATGFELATVLESMNNVYDEGDQASVRFILWQHGLEAISASPLIGFGPGAFSGIDEPFSNAEAHNTFIDWTMCTGSSGLLIYLVLLIWVISLAWQSKNYFLLCGIVSLVSFSAFHYVLRQPIFWYNLVMIASLCQNHIQVNVRLKPQTG